MRAAQARPFLRSHTSKKYSQDLILFRNTPLLSLIGFSDDYIHSVVRTMIYYETFTVTHIVLVFGEIDAFCMIALKGSFFLTDDDITALLSSTRIHPRVE